MKEEKAERFLAFLKSKKQFRDDDAARIVSLARMDCTDCGLGAEEADGLLRKAEAALETEKELDADIECFMYLSMSSIRCKCHGADRESPPGKSALDLAKLALTSARKSSSRSLEEVASLHAVAEAQAQQRLYKECSDTALEALDILNELQAVKEVAILLTNMARWYLDAGSASQAREMAEDALGYFQAAAAEDDKEVEAVEVACKVLVALGCHSKAIHLCKKALARYRANGSASAVARGLQVLVDLYVSKEDAIAGLAVVDEAVSAVRAAGNQKALVHMLTAKATFGAKVDRLDASAGALAEAQQVSESLSSPRLRASVEHAKAEVALKANLFDDAIDSVLKEQGIFSSECPDKKSYGLATLYLCDLYVGRAKWEEAEHALSSASAAFTEAGWVEGMAMVSMHQAEMHELKQERSEAMSAAFAASGGFGEAGNIPKQVEALLLSSSLATELRKQNDAHDLAREATSCAKAFGNIELTAAALGVLAQTSLLVSDYDGASEAAAECVELYKQRHDPVGQAYAHALCATGHSKAGRRAEAQPHAKAAAAMFDALRDENGKAAFAGVLQQQASTSQTVAAPSGLAAASDAAAAAAPAAKRSSEAGAMVAISSVSSDMVLLTIQKLAQQVIGVDDDEDLDTDTPLMAAGMGSRQSVMFVQAIQDQLPQVRVPATLAFDYPSAKDVAKLLSDQLGLL